MLWNLRNPDPNLDDKKGDIDSRSLSCSLRFVLTRSIFLTNFCEANIKFLLRLNSRSVILNLKFDSKNNPVKYVGK